MPASDSTRAILSPSESDAKTRNVGGRPRKKLADDVLRRALEAGADYDTIAKANECSARTVARRTKAARARYGEAWGKPLKAPEPPSEPDARPLPPTAPPWAVLTVKARALFDEVLEGRAVPSKLLPHQITVARAIISSPPPAESGGNSNVDHAELLAKVEKATGAPPKRGPDLSEKDLAPEATIDGGAPGA